MFIITADGTWVNLSRVNQFEVQPPDDDGQVACLFRFGDRSQKEDTITVEQLAMIDRVLGIRTTAGTASRT